MANPGQDAAEAELASKIMREYKQAASAPGKLFTLPGGRIGRAEDYIGGSYKTERHHSVLAITSQNAHEYFTDEWLADHPGYEYAWVKVSDRPDDSQSSRALGLLNQGIYQAVPADAFDRDKSPLMTFTHVTVQGDRLCQIYDVALVCMTPQAHRALYFNRREARSVAAMVGNTEKFYDQADKLGGRADTWRDKRPEPGDYAPSTK